MFVANWGTAPGLVNWYVGVMFILEFGHGALTCRWCVRAGLCPFMRPDWLKVLSVPVWL